MTICKRLLPFLALALLFVPAAAQAEAPAPQWTVTSVSRPTNLAPGDRTGEDEYVLTVTNTGGSSSDGSPVTVTDELPGGLSLDPRGAFEEKPPNLKGQPLADFICSRDSCSTSSVMVPGESAILVFPVDVLLGEASSVTNVVRVSGGGAPGVFVETPTTISPEQASFGVSLGGASTALSSVQAGAHADLTTSVAFNTVNALGSTAGDVKNVTDDLPPGFAGDLVDTPACQPAVFLQSECPVPTQVGVTTVTLTGKDFDGPQVEPVYNLAPSPGDVARLGFAVAGLFFQGNVVVRPGDYGLETTFFNASEGPTEVNNVSLTIWGSPSDPIHDPLRYENTETGRGTGGIGSFGHSSDAVPVPFFTNPTACTSGPLTASISVTSWQQPELSELPATTGMTFGPLVGCDRLQMEPDLTAEATTDTASSPSGLDLNMKIPQTYENPHGLATSTLKQAVVTLPEGMTVNPSAGAGLGVCSEAQYSEEQPPEETAQLQSEGHGCPSDSKLGTVKIVTPSLKEEITGSVFLAEPAPFGEQGKNPFGSLLALYIVARAPERGILVKAAGEVQANTLTGQLVTTFDTTETAHPHAGLPPLPFSLFTFRFNQGATSPLVTPASCGAYEVKAQLMPWATPEDAPLTPQIAPFPIATAFDGGACPAGAPPFDPQVAAGTENPNAGAYTPLNIHITRNDGEQEITGFSSQLPPGLTANLAGVPFCSEQQIATAASRTGAQEEAQPSCPVASEIGTTLVGAGVGSILAQAPGKIYMAGPYDGAPFSVAAITSAHVGPFDLGTVVVHLPLSIDPETAAVSIPGGAADQIPHIINGIVVHVRDIRVDVNRPNFTLNPTSCNPFDFTATVIGSGQNFASSADDVPVKVEDPFRVTACQALQFAPKLTASTSGKTSKVDGASLHVDLTYPAGALGHDANIREVKVDLPEQLPSRLSTLQKACTAAQFKANPAGCPSASVIGTARAITPILPVPLEGPAYFVSHGGEAFPDLEIVLQGDGVTIVLTGNTFISKAGITSSTFKTVPDQPVTSFELTLPEGRYSALAANGNLCAPTRTVTTKKTVKEKIHGKTRSVTKTTSKKVAESLSMPTEFTGQNGALIKGANTRIAVTSCTKAKPAKKPAKKKGKGKKK